MKTSILSKNYARRNRTRVQQLRILRNHGIAITRDDANRIIREAWTDRFILRQGLTPEYFPARITKLTVGSMVRFATGGCYYTRSARAAFCH